jgi:hypothetical protein
MERKWEIKVYAANGLMRAGAWGAAWGEMEKIDVEVGVWMPAEVRRDVEARLLDIGYNSLEEEDTIHGASEESQEERRRREIYGSPAPDSREKTDGLSDDDYHDRRPGHGDHHIHPSTGQRPPPVGLPPFILNYLRALTQDRRNVAIVFLAVLVLFYAMASPASRSASSAGFRPTLRQDTVTTTVTATATPTTRSECASDWSTPLSESMSALTSVSATECLPVTGSASPRDSLVHKNSAAMAAPAAGTSEEPQPGLQPIVAAFVRDEAPVDSVMMEGPGRVACI